VRGLFRSARCGWGNPCPEKFPGLKTWAESSFRTLRGDDPEEAKVWPFVSESTGRKFYIHCWFDKRFQVVTAESDGAQPPSDFPFSFAPVSLL